MTVVDTIFKALAPALPDKVIAGHHADLLLAKMGGFHPRDGKLFLYTGGLIGGGWGAKQGEDGMSATIAINDGDTHNGPSEQVEAKFPLLVERYRLRDDSGGPGRWRGGLGTEQVVRALSGVNFDSQIERVQTPPWGLFGGLSGAGNQVALQRKGEDEVAFPSGKVLSRFLTEGDRFMLRSGGGGGFGSPLERDLEALADDIRQGYVSAEAARRFYGVVFDRCRPNRRSCNRSPARGNACARPAEGRAVHTRARKTGCARSGIGRRHLSSQGADRLGLRRRSLLHLESGFSTRRMQ